MSDLVANAQRMLKLFEQMRDVRHGSAFGQIKRLNLSFSHMRTLHLLAPDNVLSMKELAEQLHLTAPSVTMLIRHLIHINLVQRSQHADDSRVSLVSLTQSGRELYAQLTQEHTERMATLLRGLSADEQTQFLDLLERAVHAMQNDRD